MSAVARWSLSVARLAAACLGALAIHACGSSADLADRSGAAASPEVAAHADAPGAAAPAASRDDDGGDEAKIQIKTLSNRADLISGGDALVEIVLSKAKLARSLRVQLNGPDVSTAFAVRAKGRILGLVTGLLDGKNVLVASTSKSNAASLAIINHPIGGP